MQLRLFHRCAPSRGRQTLIAILTLFVVLVAACQPNRSSPSLPTGGERTSPVGDIDYVRYVGVILDLLEHFYFRAGDVDWKPLRARTLRSLPDRASAVDAYLAISSAIFSMSHTQFYAPGNAPVLPEEAPGPGPTPKADRLEGGIGYLYVPGTDLAFREAYRTYATRLQDGMRSVDGASPVCGWVIDLRENTGGNIVPMLLGLAPLLGTRVFLSYVGNQDSDSWSYQDGRLLVNGQPFQEFLASEPNEEFPYNSPFVVPEPPEVRRLLSTGYPLQTDPYEPNDPSAPVAVLTSNRTGSAGEGVLVGFLGRPRTRVFGAATFGVPTGVVGFHMVDGAFLAVAASRAQDRLGRMYEEPIQPNEKVVDPSPSPNHDQALDAASGWLHRQEECGRNA